MRVARAGAGGRWAWEAARSAGGFFSDLVVLDEFWTCSGGRGRGARARSGVSCAVFTVGYSGYNAVAVGGLGGWPQWVVRYEVRYG